MKPIAPKLVRARPKEPEYLPEWAKCCPESLALSMRNSIRIGECDLDISKQDEYKARDKCPWCGHPYPVPIKGALIISGECAGNAVAFDFMDIDEGAA